MLILCDIYNVYHFIIRAFVMVDILTVGETEDANVITRSCSKTMKSINDVPHERSVLEVHKLL